MKGIYFMSIKLIDHILVQDRLARLRRSGINGSDFRHYMKEIGMFMSYEFAKSLEKENINVKTPLGYSKSTIIKNESDILIVNVLRAATPLVDGIIKIFNKSHCGLIGAWREDTPPFKVNLNYIRIPDINSKTVLIADPMLATGNTLLEILQKIKTLGNPGRIILFNVISSEEGIKKLLNFHPELEIYTCAIDTEVNKDGYIVPGLGDAGDICFGKPL
jgi:uracil phosphoribosyltransferase